LRPTFGCVGCDPLAKEREHVFLQKNPSLADTRAWQFPRPGAVRDRCWFRVQERCNLLDIHCFLVHIPLNKFRLVILLTFFSRRV
jgi:hypothetical protein